MDGIVKRVAVVVLAVVLPVVAWLLWGSGGGPSVDDIAGVYRFDPLPAIEGVDPGPDDEFGPLIQSFRRALKTSELTLNPDGSYAWSLFDGQSENGLGPWPVLTTARLAARGNGYHRGVS